MKILNLGSSAAPGTEVHIPEACAEYYVRVVDATGVPIAFTLADKEDPGKVLHFTAGESWTEDDLALEAALVLMIVSVVGGTVEVGLWEG